jgi:hypothetical protein
MTAAILTKVASRVSQLSELGLHGFGPSGLARLLISSFAVGGALVSVHSFAEEARVPRLIDELSPQNQQALKEGVQIVFTQGQPGPWPKVTLYQKVLATPEECLAVFSDYELQVKYIPQMVSSKIVNRPDALTADVESVLDLPWPFGTDSYVMRDRIGAYSLSATEVAYRLDWDLVRSGSFRDAKGLAQFEAFDGGTVMLYQNSIYPKNSMAGAVSKEMIKGIRQSAFAIKGQIEKERLEERPLLDRQIQALRASLRGESVELR